MNSLLPLFCTACGQKIEAGSRFCGHCGATVSRPDTASDASLPSYDGPEKATHPGGVVQVARTAINSWVMPFNASLLFAGTLAGLFDFLSPRLALLPVAAAVAVAGLLVTLLLRRYIAPSLPDSNRLRMLLAPDARLHRSPLMIAAAVLSAVMVSGAAWSSALAPGGGIIASKFDAVRNAQQQLGVLQGLQKEQRVQTAVMEDIREGRSANPRRELANQGILWTLESFNSALKSHDLQAVGLFLAGGMRWRLYQVQHLLTAQDDEAARLFLSYPAQIGQSASECADLMRTLVRPDAATRDLPLLEQKAHALTTMERRFLKTFCAQPENVAAAAAVLKQYEQSRQQALDDYKRRQAAAVPGRQCEQLALANGGQALFLEAASFNILAPTTYTPRQELLASFNIALVTGGEGLTPKLVESVKKYCLTQATPQASSAVSDTEVQGMQQVMGALQ